MANTLLSSLLYKLSTKPTKNHGKLWETYRDAKVEKECLETQKLWIQKLQLEGLRAHIERIVLATAFAHLNCVQKFVHFTRMLWILRGTLVYIVSFRIFLLHSLYQINTLLLQALALANIIWSHTSPTIYFANNFTVPTMSSETDLIPTWTISTLDNIIFNILLPWRLSKNNPWVGIATLPFIPISNGSIIDVCQLYCLPIFF